MNTIASVQWMWAAVTAAGLTGAYLGYRRSLDEDEARRQDFIRVTALEKEKERRQAEAHAKAYEERKKMKELERSSSTTVTATAAAVKAAAADKGSTSG